MNPYTVKFEQNDLNLPGVKVTNHEFNMLPSREIAINKLARRDLSIITSAEYSQKSITVSAEVCGGDRGQTEEVLTLLKRILQPKNGELRVLQNGYEVRYTATMNELGIEWEGTTAYVTIVFIASDPFGETVELLTFSAFTHTASQSFSTAEFIGSGTIEPTINITINSLTGSGEQDIKVFNARTNQGITLTRVWTAGEIITIDSSNKQVDVDGGLIDFTGLFPTFAGGTQQVGISDTFTARNMNVSVGYYGKLV